MDISVVIPLYNKKYTIQRAIESVINQEYSAKEIIVINDGSTDNSADLIKKMNVSMLKFIEQQNMGVSAARNKGIMEAKHEWIAFLDADDVWLPSFLKKIKYLHEKYSKSKVFATAYLETDDKGTKRRILIDNTGFDGEDGIIDNYFKCALNTDPPIWTSAVCIHKDSLKKIDGFPIGIKTGEDLLTWAKLSLDNEIAISRECHSMFMRDVNPWDTGRITDVNDFVGEELIELSQYVNESKKESLIRYVGYWYVMRVSSFLRAGMMKEARKAIKKAIKYGGANPKVLLFYILSYTNKKYVQRIFKLYHR